MDVNITNLSQDEALGGQEPWIVSIGNFDGVHLGHRHLLQESLKMAKSLAAKVLVYTFQPHPSQVLVPEKPFYRLFDFQDQVECFRLLGVDQLRVIKFTDSFAKIEAAEFYKKYIAGLGKVAGVVIGHDFHFGYNRGGGQELLTQACQRDSIKFQVVLPFKLEGQIVSSRRIREFLAAGQLKEAEQFLGRKYFLRGPVVHGAKRGRTIGFPTANLEVADELVGNLSLCKGVYLARLYLGPRVVYGVVNVGTNPTVSSENSLKIEAHIFNFAEDIYGVQMKIEPLKFLRPERKFNDVAELKLQISADLRLAETEMQKEGFGK